MVVLDLVLPIGRGGTRLKRLHHRATLGDTIKTFVALRASIRWMIRTTPPGQSLVNPSPTLFIPTVENARHSWPCLKNMQPTLIALATALGSMPDLRRVIQERHLIQRVRPRRTVSLIQVTAVKYLPGGSALTLVIEALVFGLRGGAMTH